MPFHITAHARWKVTGQSAFVKMSGMSAREDVGDVRLFKKPICELKAPCTRWKHQLSARTHLALIEHYAEEAISILNKILCFSYGNPEQQQPLGLKQLRDQKRHLIPLQYRTNGCSHT